MPPDVDLKEFNFVPPTATLPKWHRTGRITCWSRKVSHRFRCTNLNKWMHCCTCTVISSTASSGILRAHVVQSTTSKIDTIITHAGTDWNSQSYQHQAGYVPHNQIPTLPHATENQFCIHHLLHLKDRHPPSIASEEVHQIFPGGTSHVI